MLQKIRDGSQGWITWFIVGLIALTFIVIESGNYLTSTQAEAYEKVEGFKLKTATIDKLAKRWQLGSDATQTMPVIRKKAITALIEQEKLKQIALKMHLVITEAQVFDFIRGFAEFQEKGQFSPDKYKQILYQLDYTDPEFRQEIQTAMLINQVKQGLQQSTVVIDNDIGRLASFEHQTRSVDFMIIPNAAFAQEAIISETQIRDYYQKQGQKFVTQEAVKAHYVELKVKENDEAGMKRIDQFMSLVYEHPGSLVDVSEKMNLPIQQSGLITKDLVNNPEIFKDPKVQAALFGEEVLGGMNSEVIALSPTHHVVFHLDTYHPSKPKTLAMATEDIRQHLRSEMAAKKADHFAMNMINALQKKSTLPPTTFKWEKFSALSRGATTIPLPIMEEIFRLPRPPQEGLIKKMVINTDYQAIIWLKKVNDENSRSKDNDQFIARYAQDHNFRTDFALLVNAKG